MVVKVQLAFR